MQESMPSPEDTPSPEELIAGMNPDEICELLEEMGVNATLQQATAIQALVIEFGSLDATLELLSKLGESNVDDNARAA
jgi:hypothetical protein